MKRIIDNFKIYLEHLSEREKWMLLGMAVFIFISLTYTSYFFLFKKKMDKLDKLIDKQLEMLTDIKISGEVFLQNKDKSKDVKRKPSETEVQLYSLIGSIASKNGIEIKSINEKPITQKSKEITEKQVEILVSNIMLDKLSKFLTDIENVDTAPLVIKSLNIKVDYSDATKLNAKLFVSTYYKKAEGSTTDKDKKE